MKEKQVLQVIVCKNCGKTFKQKATNQIYCCGECYKESKRTGKTLSVVNCAHCGKEFMQTNSGNQKYCCKECAKAVKGKQCHDAGNRRKAEESKYDPVPEVEKPKRESKIVELCRQAEAMHMSYGYLQAQKIIEESRVKI